MNVPEDQRPGPGHEEEASEPPVRGATTSEFDSLAIGPSGGAEARDGETSLRDLLAVYDQEVRVSLRKAIESTSGTEKVRVLHNGLSRLIAVHDAVLESAVCPLVEDLPGGSAIADRLLQGCRERSDLLNRFKAVSKGVAAVNVYPVSAEEIERILGGLERSFSTHVHDEATEVADALEAAAGSIDPDLVAARMAFEVRRASNRTHAAILKHPSSALLKSLYRQRDRIADWVDAHHGWADPQDARSSPRALEVEELRHEASGSPPTVRDLLAGYDSTVDAFITELGAARTDVDKTEAAHRLNAAITIHDSVVGGVLCPLLDAVPGGKESAARLRGECLRRGELQLAWNALSHRFSAGDLYRLHRSEAEAIIEPLIENFRSHEKEETLEAAELLEQLPDATYRTKASPLEDFMWPWHSEGPGALALRMARWAEASPTRAHSSLIKHPSSRALRSFYHFTDRFGDSWGDTPLEKWLFPRLPSASFPESRSRGSRRRVAR